MGCCSRDLDRRWKGGVVPFTIHSSFTELAALRGAIREVERLTNVRFIRRVGQGSGGADFVEFRPGQFNCQSQAENGDGAIGRQGGRQIVFCVPGSGESQLIHEIGHAIGLYHEHERSDRNNFVTVLTGNIMPNRTGNFTRRASTLNSDPYDFVSIMHYPANAFSVDGSPTIQPVTPGQALGGTVMTAIDRAFLDTMYPATPVVRRSDSSIDPDHAGDAREIASTRIDGTRDVVTAIVDDTDDHRLLLIRWRVDDRGGIARIADTHGAPAGRASSVSVADVGGRIVVAFRSSTKNLMLIAYDASGGGLTRFPSNSGDQAGGAMQIKVIALSRNRCLTACRTDDSNRRLLLILWEVNADGSVTRRGDSGTQAGEASDIAITFLRRLGGSDPGVLVATASRTAPDTGRVRVIVWFIGDDNRIERRGDTGDTGDHALGDASQLALIGRHDGRTLVLSCRDSNSNLLLISLSVSDNGHLVQRVDSTHGAAGGIFRNALVPRPYGCLSVTTDAGENLFLVKWELDNEGRLRRLGDSGDKQAGHASIVTAVAVSADGNAPIVTPVRSGRPSLLLLSWDDRPANGELRL